jgi:hypothetical protein
MITELLICEATARSGIESVFEFKLAVAIATGLPAPPCEAVMEVVPAAIPLAMPEPAPMVATVVFEEDHAEDAVTFCVVPSL